MADYPDIDQISEIDTATPAGTEVAAKLDDAVRQIKKFLTTFLAVSHADAGALKASAVTLVSIADALITYAKIQNVSATDKILGRSTAGAGVIEEITCTAAARSILDDASVSAMRTTLGLGTIALLNTITAANITAGTITATEIAATTITDAKIATATITGAKIASTTVEVGNMKFAGGSNSDPKVMAKGDGVAAEMSIGGVMRASVVAGVLTFAHAGTVLTGSGADQASLPYARLEEQRASGTAAGDTVAAASWADRAYWAENDPAGLVTVSGSAPEITIAKQGSYWIRISVPCSAAGFHRCRLYNVTTSAVIKEGTIEQVLANSTTRSEICEVVTIATDATVLKVQTRASAGVVVGGLGGAGSLGTEIYSLMEIIKLN